MRVHTYLYQITVYKSAAYPGSKGRAADRTWLQVVQAPNRTEAKLLIQATYSGCKLEFVPPGPRRDSVLPQGRGISHVPRAVSQSALCRPNRDVSGL